MTVEQQRAAESVEKLQQLLLDGPVKGAVGLLQPVLEFVPRYGLPPQRPVRGGAPRNDAEPAPCPWAQRGDRSCTDHGRIDLILGSVAVHGRTRGHRDHGADAGTDGAFDQLVDERIFERVEGPLDAPALERALNESVEILLGQAS